MKHQIQCGECWEPVTVSLYRRDRKLTLPMGSRYRSAVRREDTLRFHRLESALLFSEAIDGKIRECHLLSQMELLVHGK